MKNRFPSPDSTERLPDDQERNDPQRGEDCAQADAVYAGGPTSRPSKFQEITNTAISSTVTISSRSKAIFGTRVDGWP